MHYLWRPLKIRDGPRISLMLVSRENYSLFNSSLSFLSKSGWIETRPKYSDQSQRTATRLRVRVGESSTFVSRGVSRRLKNSTALAKTSVDSRQLQQKSTDGLHLYLYRTFLNFINSITTSFIS